MFRRWLETGPLLCFPFFRDMMTRHDGTTDGCHFP